MRLLVITDWTRGERALLAALEPVCALGAEVGVQHRHPGADTRSFLAQARILAALCAPAGNPLFVNGRLDVALLVDAHLHLPVDAPTVAEVRPLLPAGRWVSAAVHDRRELSRAAGADLVLLSPVFAPGSKPTDARPPLGPAGFRELRAHTSARAFALGGMRPDRLAALGQMDGVAVQTAVLDARDPAAAADRFLVALRQQAIALPPT